MSIFDDFDNDEKNSIDSENSEIGAKNKITKKTNYNNYDPNNYNTTTSNALPKWFKIALVVLMVIVVFAVGIVVGVFGFQDKNDMKLLNEVKSFVEKYYNGEIDWNSVDLNTTNAMLQYISKFNGISLKSAPGSVVFGMTYVNNEYGSRYLSGVYPESSLANAVGDEMDVLKIDKTSGSVTVEKTPQGKKFKARRGDKLLAVTDYMPSTNAYILLDGMQESYFDLYLSIGYLTILFEREESDGTVSHYQIHLLKSGASRTYSEYYNLSALTGNQDDSNIGYVTLEDFSEESLNAFFNSMKLFLNDTKANRLVLDLRNNGGGRIIDFAAITPFLIPHDSGVLPLAKLADKNNYTETYNTEYKTIGGVKNDYLWDSKSNFKLAILTNGSTASASELLIGAVNYYNDDAVIVGTDTYGKGVAQAVLDLTVDGKDYELAIVYAYSYVPLMYNGSMTWVNYHEKTVPIDINFFDSENLDGLTAEEYLNLNRPYYDISKELVTARAIQELKS